jgi:hypothetical protein
LLPGNCFFVIRHTFWHIQPKRIKNEKAFFTAQAKSQAISPVSGCLYAHYYCRTYLQLFKSLNMLTAILIAAGLLGFVIFFKAIDFFDKI